MAEAIDPLYTLYTVKKKIKIKICYLHQTNIAEKYYFYIFFLDSFLIFFVHSMLSELQSMQEKTKKTKNHEKQF